jgi:hypothetical protein
MGTVLTDNLTTNQKAAVDDYRQKLAREFPEIHILSVDLREGAVDIRLSDNADRDVPTLRRTTELALEVEDDHPGVCLLPRTVGHAE